jgi:xanthine dehydrogenase accessory factor
MRDVGATVSRWVSDVRPVALARVIGMRGLGAAPVGELLAVRDDGELAGSLLHGVLDEPVRAAAKDVLDRGGATVVDAPISEPTALGAGLACSGHAQVLVHRVGPVEEAFAAALTAGEPVALVTGGTAGDGAGVGMGPGVAAVLADRVEGDADPAAVARARALLERGVTAADEGPPRVDAYVPPPQVLVVGGGVLAGALDAQAGLLGWPCRATADLAEAAAAVEAFGPGDVLVLLDHDPAADAVLAAGLRTGRGFLGALGSRHTQAARRQRLLDAGFGEADLGRIHGPVGLDLGARTPAGTAVSIVAEVLAVRAGRDPAALGAVSGPIH